MLQLISQAAAGLVFSNTCETCDTPLKPTNPLGVCEKCQAGIHWIRPPFCQTCGRPMIHDWLKCADCQTTAFHFDRAFSPALYEGTMKSLLHAYKFKRQKSLKNFFAGALCRFIEDVGSSFEFDCVAAVPLDRGRQNERGFNQAGLLSSFIAKKYKKLHLSRPLIRQKPGAAQSLLAKNERKENIFGCFAVTDPAIFKNRRVLLIDDILTTGLTASECARVLKEAGAEKVTVLAIARGL